MDLVDTTIKEFQALTRRYALFHAAFLSAFACELLTLLIFTPFLTKTILFAVVVALLFLTVFTYFVLRFYFQTKKPEQFAVLKDQFLSSLPRASSSGDPLETMRPVYEVIHKLQGQESQYYSLPAFLQTLLPLVEKFSVWCHWDDVQWMKETLYLHVVSQLFEKIKLFPTNPELHRALATSYVSFYHIYQMPTGRSSFYSFIERQYSSLEMREKFERAAHAAAQELKIVLSYIPQDVGALHQLAQVYHDLGLLQEEVKVYELLISLRPQDGDIQYALGRLYFELGQMAQGLRLYQELKGRQDPKAYALIEHYDALHRLFA